MLGGVEAGARQGVGHCWGTAALGSCDGKCAFSHVVFGLTSAFPARGKLPLPDPHQAEAEPGLLPVVCGGDAAGARRVDRSRGVALPRLPRDLLQQLLLNCQAAGNKDVQAGGCLERAGTAAPGPAAGERPWPLLACCLFFSATNRLEECVASTLCGVQCCYFAVVLLFAERAPRTPSAVSFLQSALSEAGHTGRAGALVSQAREAVVPVVSETGGRTARLLAPGLGAPLCVLACILCLCFR